MRADFEDRHRDAEPREGLRELAADRSAADDREATGVRGQREDRLVGEEAGLVEPGDRRRRGARAGRDDGAAEAQPGAADLERVGGDESPVAEEHVDAEFVAEALRRVVRRDRRADRAHALHRGAEIGHGARRPWVAPRRPRVCASLASRPARISAFDGTQPMFRQSPPSRSRSTSATVAPSPAATAAATSPPVPAPSTTRL